MARTNLIIKNQTGQLFNYVDIYFKRHNFCDYTQLLGTCRENYHIVNRASYQGFSDLSGVWSWLRQSNWQVCMGYQPNNHE